jgi:hypothetical protein
MTTENPIAFWWSAIDRTVPRCSECGEPAEYKYSRHGDYTEYGMRCAKHVPRRPPDPCTYRDGRGLWCCGGCVFGSDGYDERWTAKGALAHIDKHEAAGHGGIAEAREHILRVGDVVPHSRDFGSAYTFWENHTGKRVTVRLTFDEGERWIVLAPIEEKTPDPHCVSLHPRYDDACFAAGLTAKSRSPGMKLEERNNA